jgi:type I restriction-modification system DNA methylase subunit
MSTTITKPNDPLNPTFDEAAGLVSGLVRDFSDNERHYLSGACSEAQVRMDFIDKFLIALGWDVKHDIQKNPFEQEVKVERHVQTATAQRRADYALALAPHFDSPILYVEAKKPCDDIATADNYFQTIRYANQRGHAIGILTSFAQLHVIDCRYQANIDTAIHRAITKYNYADLANPEKFAEIFFLFSRPETARGSIERFAESLPKPKGRPGQKAFLAVAYKQIDERLLETLDDLRRDLARALKNRNARLESTELTELTQRILDRLVFIRFLEDKLIEPTPIIPTLGNSGRTAWEDFLAASRRLDQTYNGIVFKHHATLDNPGELTIDDKPFTDILDALDFHHSKYLFNDIPLHILGSIYERFLGNVIVATAKRASLEPKPEVRKAGGVYYTPKYVVDYIVRNSVGELIKGKTPTEIAKMRFADISCGSGSFLLGVYDYLLRYMTLWYNDHPNKAPKAAVVKREGTLHLSLKEKGRILTNNIYGVDLDPQAVEVAQLSLYLKLLEEETTASAHQYTLEFHRPLLPSLADNIKCGNSLIGHDFYDKRQGDLFDPDKRRHINAFDWLAEFPDIFRAGGFDAIVGNPPYISIQTMNEAGPDEVKYFNAHYKSAGKGSYDIYVVFVERAFTLLNRTGLLGFILPSKFFATDYGKPLRGFVSAQKALAEVVDFRHEQVFDQAATYTCLLFLSHKARSAARYSSAVPPEVIQKGTPPGFAIDLAKLSDSPWIFSPASHLNVLEKMRENTIELLALPSMMSRGSSTGNDNVFMLKAHSGRYTTRDGVPVEVEKDILRTPIYATDFGRYRFAPNADERVIFPYVISHDGYEELGEKELGDQYPKAYAYLKSRKPELLKRKQFKSWYGFSAPRNLDVHRRAHLMVPLLANTGLYCALPRSMDQYCPMASGGFTIAVGDQQPLSPLYVLGVLNSRLLYWVLKHISNVFRGGWITCTKQYVGTLPIRLIDRARKADKSRHDRLVELVEAILGLRPQLVSARTASDKTLLQRQIDATDRQIDTLVYELYGLNEAEIKIVEEATGTPSHEDAGVNVSDGDSQTSRTRTKKTRVQNRPPKNGATRAKKARQKARQKGMFE